MLTTYPYEKAESHLVAMLPQPEWFAVRTRPRHEKLVNKQLETNGIETYLPVSTQVRSWSDRRKVVDFPLFPGYLFVHTPASAQFRMRVFQARGVMGFVGPHNEAASIPAEQIEAVRCMLQAQAKCRPHPYLNVGQRVRIRNGALQGLEGILVRRAGNHSLVVSVDLIQKSVSVTLDGYEVEGL
jgi:transcription termination/antitermination protein NusG